MANSDHLAILKKGRKKWNQWRLEHPEITPDLSGIEFQNVSFNKFNLSNTILRNANLEKVFFVKSNLSHADFSNASLRRIRCYDADLSHAIFDQCDLTYAKLTNANLSGAKISNAILTEAKLNEANLQHAQLFHSSLEKARLIETDLRSAVMVNCSIYGISAWNIQLDANTVQKSLRITKEGEPEIQVDDLEVAQFIYLLLNNQKIRNIIEVIGKKGVLLLGRFIPERKRVLDRLREELKSRGFVPMMFDFDKSSSRDFTETIKTLAGLSRFVIADITNPKSSPLELQATIPDYQIPFITIIQSPEEPFSMFRDLHNKYAWVHEPITYDHLDNLVLGLDHILAISDEMYQKMISAKSQKLKTTHINDLINKRREES
ncbi:MAG: pentapeptide repeat-containing protein [Bacteroidota bacterium]